MIENTGENSLELEKTYRTTAIVVIIQIVVVLTLVFVAWCGIFKVETNPANTDFTTIWVAVLFIAIGSFVLRRTFFNWERLKNIAVLKGVPGILKTLQRNSVLLGMMAFSVGAIGFVIAILSGNSFDMVRAAVISLVVFLINFPRKKVWKTIISNIDKV